MDNKSTEPFRGYNIMVNVVGKRHATCWFDNFDVGSDEFANERLLAKQTVSDYARNLQSHKDNGTNLILFGSCGTGKDHLAVSVLRVALSMHWIVRYRRGSVICNECRRETMEKYRDVPPEMTDADLLVISDIEPHADKPATEFEQRALLELIDRRYAAMLPTVVTSNLQSRDELVDRLGERLVDRLLQCAEVVPMSWPSYRAAQRCAIAK